MSGTLNERVAAFVRDVCAAMGVSLDATVEETADNVWIQLAGADGDLLLEHKAEALEATQHVAEPFDRLRRGVRVFYEFSKTKPE